jgi:hypothetical protein
MTSDIFSIELSFVPSGTALFFIVFPTINRWTISDCPSGTNFEINLQYQRRTCGDAIFHWLAWCISFGFVLAAPDNQFKSIKKGEH